MDLMDITDYLYRRKRRLSELSDIESSDGNNAGIIRSRWSDAPPKVELTIRHQFPGVELVSPVYAGDNTAYNLISDQRVNVGSMTRIEFYINSVQNVSIGALIYKLQRKNTEETDEDEATCLQLLIIWKVNNSNEFSTVSHLIEHDSYHVWTRAKLMWLARRYRLFDMQYNPIEETWLMHDHTVLMKRVDMTCGEKCYKLETTISEASIKDDTLRPWYINVKE
jgi:hypothetical protein